MMLPNRYQFHETEAQLSALWGEKNLYAFQEQGSTPTFTIDTPPPTVSGELHIGHCYSYTQADVIARFERMRGKRVFYPMGFDDNGLPTERYIEKMLQKKASDMGRAEFLAQCFPIIEQTEARFINLWQRLGLSVDWQQRYTTLSPQAQRTSQWSFIKLYEAGLAYTQLAPTLWCPECQTAIAQAEIEDSSAYNLGVHERCGTPVEQRHMRQWFIRILEHKERFLEAGRQIRWQPAYMHQRYEHWVEQLQWDWCISRQRFLGVPFPTWTCQTCGEMRMASLEQLPIDPALTLPTTACTCGETSWEPEADVMDTWATSSCSPFILAQWPDDEQRLATHVPIDLRPQAHDIIRTWAFYTIVRSLYQHNALPWREILVSGHALSMERKKLAKSQQQKARSPMDLIEHESADALRYWATSVKPGSDTPFRPDLLQNGRKLMNKLWNAARFAEKHILSIPSERIAVATLSSYLVPLDRWLFIRLAQVTNKVTRELENRDYAAARTEIERFFWSDFCDNYLELIKARLHGEAGPARDAAQWTLYHVFLSILKLFAPYQPFVTDTIYQHLYQATDKHDSIHLTAWPTFTQEQHDAKAEEIGSVLLEILGMIRRYKAEQGLSMGSEVERLELWIKPELLTAFVAACADLKGATRARCIQLHAATDGILRVEIGQYIV